jgi:hypothetical protein
VPHRDGSWPAACKDHVGSKFNQLGCQRRQPRHIGTTKASINTDVAPIDPAQFFQALHEPHEKALNFQVRLRDPGKKTDAPHADILLCAPNERPSGRGAAEPSYDMASPHWIASLVPIEENYHL